MSARTPPAPAVGVISLGCAKNLVDTEVMLGHLDRAGCAFVQNPAEAEVILINTCGFIEAAREESIRTILEAAELKRTGRLKRLVVAGCLVQRHREELARTLPEVDEFLDLDELARIVPAAGLGSVPTAAPDAHHPLRLVTAKTSAPSPAPAAVAAWNRSEYLYDHETPRRLAPPSWTAYVKIAEGCDHTCSFCAIPSFRGSFRSRRPESVEQEVRGLVAAGVREAVLVAQDSSRYGRDLEPRTDLAALLERLDGIDGLRWIRVHYLYPNTVDARLIETMARLGRVVPYVDIPLQHAHPATLARMRRGGSGEQHLRLLERFRAALPEGALRSTMIVGFPGETEEEFEALLEFVEAARFDHLGCFTYSHEEATSAHALPDDVPARVKLARQRKLMSAQRRIAQRANRARVGQVCDVLVEGTHADTDLLLVGRTARQSPEVDGQVLIQDGTASPGEFVRVELTGVAGYDLLGRIVAPA